MERTYNLDRKIKLQSKTVTRGTAGGEAITWSDVASVWANIFYKTGVERFEAGKNTAVNVVIFTIRWNEWVDEIDRVAYRNQNYDITYKNEAGRKHYLQLTAERKY